MRVTEDLPYVFLFWCVGIVFRVSVGDGGFIGAGAVTYGDASEVRRDGDVSSPGILFGDGSICQDVDTGGALSEVPREGDTTYPTTKCQYLSVAKSKIIS